MPHTRSASLFSVAAVLMAVLAGCGVKGDWVLHEVRPPSAKHHFNISRIRFTDDLNFTVLAEGDDGQQIESKGSYTYSDWTRELKLHMGAKELTYTAVVWWTNELRLERELDTGNAIQARFKRAADKPESGQICPTCGQPVP